MAKLKVDELVTASAIERARALGEPVRRVELCADSPALEAVPAANVRYFPSVLDAGQSLQVLDAGQVPIEAVFDELTVEFVKTRLLASDRSALGDEIEDDCEEDVCILGNVFSRNFTHWHEELMKVIALERADVGCAFVLAELPAFARELLQMIGVPAGRILKVDRPTRFRRAWYTTPVSYRNVAEYPNVLLALRERLLDAASATESSVGRRLWLDRGGSARLGRRLINEEEVYELVDRYGFSRLDMGALPISSQIAAARDAEAFAGTHGSPFVHSQLMPPRSTVIECFSPLYQNPTYTEIYRVLEHRYSAICATNTPAIPYQYGGDVWIDCQQLDLALSAYDRLSGA